MTSNPSAPSPGKDKDMTEPRWYCITSDGVATLCVDRADAEQNAADADIQFPRRAPHRAVQLVEAASQPQQAAPVAVPAVLSDERIDFIADTVVKGMPDGISGFLKSWGWRQFARAILQDCAGHCAASPQAAPAAQPAWDEATHKELVSLLCSVHDNLDDGGVSPAWEKKTCKRAHELLERLGELAPATPAVQGEPLTWQQFVAACEAEYGVDFAPEEFADAEDGEKEELMRVVRMVERAHGITQPSQQEKNNV